MIFKATLLGLHFFSCMCVFGQKIDNTALFRDAQCSKFFRFHYENDYFSATDYYYTQGYNFELIHPIFKKNPLSKILIQPKKWENRYGLCFENYGFTPTSIRHPEIIYNDRPFAACILFKSFAISTDTTNKIRITSVFTTGMIGPIAQGKEIQTAIHRWIRGTKPQGWQNQIKNDVAVNYAIGIDKFIYAYRNFFSLYANAKINIGSLYNNAQTGFTFLLGKHNAPMKKAKAGRRFQLYGYGQGYTQYVAYDATLAGGFFAKKNPYTIENKNTNSIVYQINAGLVFQYKKLQLEYSQTYISREFKPGVFHRWGGIRIGVLL